MFKEEIGEDVLVILVLIIMCDNIDQLLYVIVDKLEEYKDVDFIVEEEELVGINWVLYKYILL